MKYCVSFLLHVFVFSSRRRHTRWPRDWSSDVCSSDLLEAQGSGQTLALHHGQPAKNELQREDLDNGHQLLPLKEGRNAAGGAEQCQGQRASQCHVGPEHAVEMKIGGIAFLDQCRSEEHTSELQSRGHLVCL